MAASATFALKAGVWFRRGRLLMVSPDSRSTACPPSGRNSTYRPVQISGTGSVTHLVAKCATDLAFENVQFSLKIDNENKITRLYPGLPELSVAYFRCSL